MGQRLAELLLSLWVELLDGLADLLVNLPSAPDQKAVVGDILCQGMLESVFHLREEVLLVDKLQPLELVESFFQSCRHTHSHLKNGGGEFPADDGGNLEGPLEGPLQVVYPGPYYPLYRLRDLYLVRLDGQHVVAIRSPDVALFQQGPGELLYEERVSCPSAQDQLSQLRRSPAVFENSLHHLGARLRRHLVDPDLGIAGLARPWIAVLRTVEQDKHDWGHRQPPHELAQEFLRCSVYPLKILNSYDEGPVPAFAEEETPDGFEGLLPLLLRRQCRVLLDLPLPGKAVHTAEARCSPASHRVALSCP